MLHALQECDNETKFENTIIGIFVCIAPTPNEINKTRKKLGLKPFSKKDINNFEKDFYKKK